MTRGDDVAVDAGSWAAAVANSGGNPLNDYDVMAPACPSRSVLRHVVDRWTPLVVSALEGGSLRFGDLKNRVGGVSPKVLTHTLRSMERDGLVSRHHTPTMPPRVDYSLTPLGRSLTVPMQALRTWAQDNAGSVLAARHAYDQAAINTEQGE